MKAVRSAALLLTLTASLASLAESAHARSRRSSYSFTPTASQPEDVDVSRIKERYWSKGDETELSVVQNRQFSKSGRLELSGFGGSVITDPFLNVRNLGGQLGYHFNEYFALKLLGWKSFVSSSAALDTLVNTQQVTANTNEPQWFGGGEAQASFLYGKLSLLGAAIIYYDLHALGGAGLTGTESGRYLTPFVGLGQQVFLSRWLTLNLDYRAMFYKEDILEKSGVNEAAIGDVVDSRVNFTNVVTLGVSILL